MNEDVSPALGISRRDLLRRGAIVGGTMVWATPVVQTISSSALAQEAGTPLEEEGAISYVAMVLLCELAGGGTETVRVKFEADSGWEDDPGETPKCMSPDAWDAARPENGGTLGIVVTGSTDRFCFDLSATDPACTFQDGHGHGCGGRRAPAGRRLLHRPGPRVHVHGRLLHRPECHALGGVPAASRAGRHPGLLRRLSYPLGGSSRAAVVLPGRGRDSWCRGPRSTAVASLTTAG